jgi:hypothetical protein
VLAECGWGIGGADSTVFKHNDFRIVMERAPRKGLVITQKNHNPVLVVDSMGQVLRFHAAFWAVWPVIAELAEEAGSFRNAGST